MVLQIKHIEQMGGLRREDKIKLCLGMENDFLGSDLIPREGRMSILFCLANIDDSYLYVFRQDINKKTRNLIKGLGPEKIEADPLSIRRLLHNYDCDEVYWGKSYFFRNKPIQYSFKDVIIQYSDNHPEFIISINDEVVSKAWTWGENELAAEVEVATHESYRRRGFAKQVVNAWASWQLDNNKIPIFSHEYSNVESGILAKSLDLLVCASILIFYQKVH